MPSDRENSILETLPTTDMAAIAASPKGLAIMFSMAVEIEFKPCLAKEGDPVTIIFIKVSMFLDI